MKTLSHKEMMDMVKAKKLSPDIMQPLKDYKMMEDEHSHELLLAEAIRRLAEAIKSQSNNNDIKALISMLNTQLVALIQKEQPEIVVKNDIPERPRRWEFEILRDGNNMLRKIIAEAKG